MDTATIADAERATREWIAGLPLSVRTAFRDYTETGADDVLRQPSRRMVSLENLTTDALDALMVERPFGLPHKPRSRFSWADARGVGVRRASITLAGSMTASERDAYHHAESDAIARMTADGYVTDGARVDADVVRIYAREIRDGIASRVLGGARLVLWQRYAGSANKRSLSTLAWRESRERARANKPKRVRMTPAQIRRANDVMRATSDNARASMMRDALAAGATLD